MQKKYFKIPLKIYRTLVLLFAVVVGVVNCKGVVMAILRDLDDTTIRSMMGNMFILSACVVTTIYLFLYLVADEN